MRSQARILALLVLSVVFVFAQSVQVAAETVRQREFRPIDPMVIAQGGSSVAWATGLTSLYGNPAGLARTGGSELTIPSFTTWVHSRPDLLLPTIGALGGQSVSSDSSTESEGKSRDQLILDNLSEQFTTNGFGLGTALGIGYVGAGIGIGFNVALDTYLYGETFPLGLEGEVNSQFTFAFGYARTVGIGPIDLSLGGALRPHLRIASIIGSDTAAGIITQFTGVSTGDSGTSDPLSAINALNGWGVAFDAGLMASYGPYAMGLQARNLFNTSMAYSNNTLTDLISSLSAGGLPRTPSEGDAAFVSETYIIPTELALGLGWDPDMGGWENLVDPRLHFQFDGLFGTGQIDPDLPTSPWTRIHLGTEIGLLRFFDMRFGINQGYFTAGAGIELLFLNVQLALYSQEFGRFPGDQQVGGAALEVALRF